MTHLETLVRSILADGGNHSVTLDRLRGPEHHAAFTAIRSRVAYRLWLLRIPIGQIADIVGRKPPDVRLAIVRHARSIGYNVRTWREFACRCETAIDPFTGKWFSGERSGKRAGP